MFSKRILIKMNLSFQIIKNSASSHFALTVRQLAILSLVYNEAIEASVDYYSKTLNLSKPAVTKAINRLEELKLVKRKPDTQDGRKVIVSSTLIGQNYIQQIQTIPYSMYHAC